MPVILFAVFIDLLGFGIIVPILPFLTMKFGGDAFTGTALISIYSLAGFVMGPVWGRFSDKFGRRPALTCTFIGAAISYCVLGFAETLFLLFFARAMSGAMAGNVGIAVAAMADLTTEENRGKAMGKVGAAFGLGFAFGPGIGGLLSQVGDSGEVGILAAGLTAAALSLIAALLTAFFVPETSPNKAQDAEGHSDIPHWSSVLKNPGQLVMFAMFVVTAIAQSVSFAITPFWADKVLGWSAVEVGYLLMATGVCVFLIQLFAVGPLFKAFGEVKALMMGVTLSLVGCIAIICMDPTPMLAVISLPLITGGLTLAFPALNSLVSRRTSKHLQGTALGMSNGFSALGRIAGPVAAGTVFAANTAAPFFIITGTAILMLAWSLREIAIAKRLTPVPVTETS
jgi:DHA1 family tetracycline resistance protein-like MFS transporter